MVRNLSGKIKGDITHFTVHFERLPRGQTGPATRSDAALCFPQRRPRSRIADSDRELGHARHRPIECAPSRLNRNAQPQENRQARESEGRPSSLRQTRLEILLDGRLRVEPNPGSPRLLAKAHRRRRRRSRIRPLPRIRTSSAASSVIPVPKTSRRNPSPPAMRRRTSASDRTIKSTANGAPSSTRIRPATVRASCL